MRRAAIALCLLPALPALANETVQASASHEHGSYHLQLEAEIEADFARVYALVTDFDHMSRLNPAILESAALAAPDGERRRFRLRSCILFYCLKARVTERIERVGGEVIIATVVPEESDFSAGRSEWRLTPVAAGRTRIRLETEVTPSFWVPPLIGPWLIQRKLQEEGRATVRRIEELARDE